MNRAPLISVPINFGVSSEDTLEVMQGPDPSPPSWAPSSASAMSTAVSESSVSPTTSKAVENEPKSGATASATTGQANKPESDSSPSLSQYYHSNNPVNLPSSSSSASTAASGDAAARTHRVPITIKEDDDDDEGDEVEIKINSSTRGKPESEEVVRSANQEVPGPDRYIDKYAVMAGAESSTTSSTATTAAATALNDVVKKKKESKKVAAGAADTTSGNKVKSSSTKSKSSSSAAAKKYTSYDLLRELTNSRMDRKKLAVIFANLKASHVPSVLQGLMEADLLFMLLKAVFVFFTGGDEEPAQYGEIVKYFEAVGSATSFSLMYSLLPADERQVIEDYLDELKTKVASDDQLLQSVRSLRNKYH